MIFPWLIILIISGYIVFSYIEHYPLKSRVMPIVALLIISLVIIPGIIPLSRMTLWAMFLFERLWILLSLVLLAEAVINKKNRVLHSVLAVIAVIVYSYLRRII